LSAKQKSVSDDQIMDLLRSERTFERGFRLMMATYRERLYWHIRRMVLIHEDADKAEEMTLKLSRLFRYSINSQHENFATVKDELEIVNTYMDIETIRFGDRIEFRDEVCEEVLQELIPRFLIQPLVENALKHGLADIISNGLLILKISKQENMIVITLADNGPDFPDELRAGYGLQSTYDKLSLLYQNNYEVQLINKPEKQVKITLPIVQPHE